MTTNVIDVNIHGSSFPATYIGSGNLIGNPTEVTGGTVNVTGYFTGAGNVTNIPVGFQPTYIRLFDETDNITWEWYRGLASTHAVKTVAAGTKTVDTTSAITVSGDQYNGNYTVSIAAAVAVSSSNIIFRIEG